MMTPLAGLEGSMSSNCDRVVASTSHILVQGMDVFFSQSVQAPL